MSQKQLAVYLERRKVRQKVGTLTYNGKENCFEFRYTMQYLRTSSAIPVGPELSLVQQEYRSEELFPSFQDRIPSRKNPAYGEYCEMTGISIDETDPLVLLGTIGRRGPSSFIFESVVEDDFVGADLKAFRLALGLTTREFASCFEIAQSTLTAIKLGHESGSEVLKRMRIYAHFPEVALEQLEHQGGVLVDTKRKTAWDYLQNVHKKR